MFADSIMPTPFDHPTGAGGPMANVLRKTGIPLMEDIPWGSHIALFYETNDDLLETCAAYFGAGLENNEFCTWAIHDSVTVEAARQALRDGIPDFDRHEAAGHIELLSVHDLEFPGDVFGVEEVIARWRAKLRYAREAGYEGVRVSAYAWLAVRQSQRYFENEREMARALEGEPMLAMATYDLGVSSAVDVLDVARVHQMTIARRHGEWQFIETPELKQANARIRQLSDALAIMSAPFPGHELLTERERAVLAQLVKGASSKEIARALGISPRTIDFHRANILQKLGARNTADIIRAVMSRE